MKKFFALLARHWVKNPVKISLTVFSVTLGTGIVILAFSAGSLLQDEISEKLTAGGTILYVANGSFKSDGTLDRQRPTEWDSTVLDKVKSDAAGVRYTVPLFTPPFDQIAAGGSSYRLRSAVGTGPEYFDVFGLGIVAGSPMTQSDVDAGNRKVWMSETTARLIYGSVEAALDQWIQPPGMRIFRGGPGGQREQNFIPQYAVAGVFSDPNEVARRSYGIGDLLFPYSSIFPAGGNAAFQRNLMSGLFLVKAEGISGDRAVSSIRQAIAANFGDGVTMALWEGSPQGESSYLRELKQAVSIFTVSVTILGFVLLLVSSLGIFSIMVVESLGRRREIALERALGASQGAVLREFWSWAFALTLLGALLGLALAAALASPVLGTLRPLLGEVSSSLDLGAGLSLRAVLLGLGLALGCGSLLGLLPAFGAVRGSISDTIREA